MSEGSERQLRIACFIGQLSVGGAERQLVELVKGLDKARFRPVIYTLSPGEKNRLAAELEPHGVEVVPIGLSSENKKVLSPALFGLVFRNLSRLAKAFSSYRKFKPDIFHGYLFEAYLLGGLFAYFSGTPVRITSRRSLHTTKTKRKNKIFNMLERFINRHTDCIVGNSRAVVRDTIEAEQVPEEKVTWIYNGVFQAASPLSSEERTGFENRWKRYPDDLLVGIVANLHKYKFHEYLLRAVPLVKQKTAQPFRAVLIGRDEGERAHLEHLAQELGIADDVVFGGEIPQAQRLMPLFAVSVLISQEEGFSNTIIESMLSGVPVIATTVGGNPEAVVDGETGFLIPPRNAESLAEKLITLIDDADLRKSMGEAGRIRVTTEFSMEKMVRKTEELYQNLVNETDERRSTKNQNCLPD